MDATVRLYRVQRHSSSSFLHSPMSQFSFYFRLYLIFAPKPPQARAHTHTVAARLLFDFYEHGRRFDWRPKASLRASIRVVKMKIGKRERERETSSSQSHSKSHQLVFHRSSPAPASGRKKDILLNAPYASFQVNPKRRRQLQNKDGS